MVTVKLRKAVADIGFKQTCCFIGAVTVASLIVDNSLAVATVSSCIAAGFSCRKSGFWSCIKWSFRSVEAIGPTSENYYTDVSFNPGANALRSNENAKILKKPCEETYKSESEWAKLGPSFCRQIKIYIFVYWCLHFMMRITEIRRSAWSSILIGKIFFRCTIPSESYKI